MVTMFEPKEATSAMLMIKSLLVFLSVFNTVVNPQLYSKLDEPLKKMMQDCADSFDCCSVLIQNTCIGRSSGNDKKTCLHRCRHHHHLDSGEHQPDRRGPRNQVGPIDEAEEIVVTSPNNDAAIFTVTQKANATKSTSRNAKTRQTYTE